MFRIEAAGLRVTQGFRFEISPMEMALKCAYFQDLAGVIYALVA